MNGSRETVGVLFLIAAMGCAGSLPNDLGARDGRLGGCPESPNCVTSTVADERHAIEPLQIEVGAESTWAELVALLEGASDVRIATRGDGYLHAEFTSTLMGYVDDVEFLVSSDESTIEVRSASRVGYGDMNANRERVEWVRSKLADRGVVRTDSH